VHQTGRFDFPCPSWTIGFILSLSGILASQKKTFGPCSLPEYRITSRIINAVFIGFESTAHIAGMSAQGMHLTSSTLDYSAYHFF
jgi:hypothetical protein